MIEDKAALQNEQETLRLLRRTATTSRRLAESMLHIAPPLGCSLVAVGLGPTPTLAPDDSPVRWETATRYAVAVDEQDGYWLLTVTHASGQADEAWVAVNCEPLDVFAAMALFGQKTAGSR